MRKIIDWHKSLVERAQKELGLTGYQMYLSGLLEGALIFWVIMKVASLFKPSPEFPF
ncbi:hypothetical protein [Prochlorococcus marinus]|uniref:hypothetical protein n=1 Tax=Prochlorococcus marinus TaxID=1219 RepID=UPI0022B3D757|nr:hypothetical protein [Prochlorococcus marinus]